MLMIVGMLAIFLFISVIAGVVLAYLGAQITEFWEAIFSLVNVMAAIVIGYTGGAYLIRNGKSPPDIHLDLDPSSQSPPHYDEPRDP